jgi:hypothetical protein
VLLKNVEKETKYYECPKSQVSIFHNYTGNNAYIQDCNRKSNERKCVVNDDDKAVDPNFTNNQIARYLTIKDQMNKYRKTKYYIIFDIETMEELVIHDVNKKIKEKIKNKIKITVNKHEDEI